MEIEKPEELLKGQAEVWQYMLSFADSMALKSAVELCIADIIHSHDSPITLSQIVSSMNSPSSDITCLARIMRLLVHKNIFTAHHPSDGGETLYGPTHASRWLLHDSDMSMANMILMENHPQLMAPWHCFSQCVKEGGIAFKKAHGREIWEFGSQNPDFNKLFNDGMACATKVITRAILVGYKDGFASIGSLVDVGGGTGALASEIVKSYPHIRAKNFDLPHVVATAPSYNGVQHIGGDMFQEIPNADAVFMKWIMHDWSDEDCIKILKNCQKAIPAEGGKVVIIDAVLHPDDQIGLAFDLMMLAHSSGGKERTEPEWKKLLEKGGFPRYNVIKLPSIPSIIEAYLV